MAQADLSRVPDSGDLRRLRTGLVIVRRTKHEWRNDLIGLSADRLRLRTGKAQGSKFLPAWTLDRLVGWIAAQVELAGWRRQNESFVPLDIRLEEPVGLADGNKVHTIRNVG